ncbi:MAG: aminoacyl--tRNA ligase-related protein [Halobacteriaceae archaeon]
MRRSDLPSFERREAPDEAHDAVRALRQAGYIRRFGSGRYAFTPIGERVHRRITERVRQGMRAIGAQPVSLPQLQSRALWERSERWGAWDGEMFTLEDRTGRQLCLAPSHEEGAVKLLEGVVRSYDDLPVVVYQIGRKHRDDHARKGLLRAKEFSMKDAYSFHADVGSLEEWYDRMRRAYREIFADLGLEVCTARAENTVMGGSHSEEFVAPVDDGTLELLACTNEACEVGITDEQARWDEFDEGDDCPGCEGRLRRSAGVEVGHIFRLGDRYAEAMDLTVDGDDGTSQTVLMGSYGIGITRVLQTLLQQQDLDGGCRWPVTARGTVAPFQASIIPLRYDGVYRDVARRLYDRLGPEEILLFDGAERTIGERFAVSDRLGIPRKLVIGTEYEATGKIEVETRAGETSHVDPASIETALPELLGE